MDIRSKLIDDLFEVIMSLKSEKDCYDFFGDLCTIKEIQDMAKRLEAAKMLRDGANYQTVCDQLGLSTATISRVNKCLNYGTGGYKKVLKNQK